MENLLWGLIPVVVGGIGSLSYFHPDVAKKLIYILSAVSVLIYLSFRIYNEGQISGFQKSSTVPHETKGYVPLIKIDFNTANVRGQHELDSINKILEQERDKLVLDARAQSLEDVLKMNIKSTILEYGKSTTQKNEQLLTYTLVAMAILGVLLLLCFFFEGFRKHAQNPTDKTKNTA